MASSQTVLLFSGLDDRGIPLAALAHFGSEAYEHYMVAPYVRELMMVRKDASYVCWSPSFDQLHAAIRALQGPVQFEELGSTLYSTIDKFTKLNARRSLDVAVHYVGIEVSRILIDIAEALHESASLQHFARWQDAPSSDFIVSRSYQSTSYAFQATDDLFDWVRRAKFGIHGIWWSLEGGEKTIKMLGNDATLFDPDRFHELCQRNNVKLAVIKSEVFTYADERFSLSWVVTNTMDQTDNNARLAIAAEPPSVCELARSDLANQPVTGDHAAIFQVRSDSPFDFNCPQIADRYASTQ